MIQNFNILEIDSLSEMQENLKRMTTNGQLTYIIGDNSQGVRGYYIVEFPDINLSIGICTALLKFRDECIIQDANGNIIIGIDGYLTWCQQGQHYTPQILDTNLCCFYTFLKFGNSHIIAVFEIGAIKIDFSGNVIWKIGFNDIVMDYKIVNDHIISITCMDQDDCFYDLNTGVLL